MHECIGEENGSPLQSSCLENPKVGHDCSNLAATEVTLSLLVTSAYGEIYFTQFHINLGKDSCYKLNCVSSPPCQNLYIEILIPSIAHCHCI